MTTAISGTITTSVSESCAFSRIAMMTPPIARIGAVRRIVSAICRKSWTCWTSFVLRVISDGVPKRVISRAEKCCTRSKTAPRTSRPTPIDARDAKYTLTMARTPRTSVTASMTVPIRQMYSVSPFATPLLMMSAFRLGRYRFAIDWMNTRTVTTRTSVRYFGT